VKNYLRDQINGFARGWHVFRRRELEASTAKSLEMLVTLLFQQMKYYLRARHCSIVSNLGYRIRQKLELIVHPLEITPNVICDFELLGFGTKML
jgi:hypothetical protein